LLLGDLMMEMRTKSKDEALKTAEAGDLGSSARMGCGQ